MKSEIEAILNDVEWRGGERKISQAEATAKLEQLINQAYRDGWETLMKQAIADKIMPVDKNGNPPYALMGRLSELEERK